MAQKAVKLRYLDIPDPLTKIIRGMLPTLIVFMWLIVSLRSQPFDTLPWLVPNITSLKIIRSPERGECDSDLLLAMKRDINSAHQQAPAAAYL